MYNMLLVSTDPGFLVLSQKFIPFEDPSIKVMPEGSIKDAVAALSDGTVDAIIFDHSENNDISDMIGGLNRLGRTVPIVMVSRMHRKTFSRRPSTRASPLTSTAARRIR